MERYSFTFISPSLGAPEKASPFTINLSPSIYAGKSAAQCSSLCLLELRHLFCIGNCSGYTVDALFSYSWQVDTEVEAMGAAAECIEKTAQAHWELTVFAAVSVLHNAALFVPDVNFAICSKRNTGMHCTAQ